MLVHSHQPVGNFEPVLEEAYQKSYRPFLQVLDAHPRIAVSLHYSGILLEWIEARHPEFFGELRRLIERGQAEMIGGGYYEPILPAIPDTDKIAQIQKLSAYLSEKLGVTPRGAWVAERVWEPSLARPLADAGIEYTCLDDTHFLAAGLEPSELRGDFISEETGHALRLVPALKSFRYTIPFREPHETLRILQEGRDAAPSPTGAPPLFVFGDDCEKFGVWPGTFEHCYKNFWLERFLQAIEGAREWLTSTTLGDYIQSSPPLGRVYLPAASYVEMMEWALPEQAARDYKACLDATDRMEHGARFRRFLLGGIWRNFLSKYPESNQIHKLMLRVSERWHKASREAREEGRLTPLLVEAQTRLLAGQCNDAYWHGAFGGLYAPHLRSGVLSSLIQAEAQLDRIEGETPGLRVSSEDFDLDGQNEILIEHELFGAIIKPADGATISSLRFKPADVELINSLMRRFEVYHELVRKRAATSTQTDGHPASIHDRVASKEANLAAFLHYDRYARHSFRTYVFPAWKTWDDFARLRLDEDHALAQGAWTVGSLQPHGTVEFHRHARVRHDTREASLRAVKAIATSTTARRWEIECLSKFSTDVPLPLALGVELVFNLLAPDAHDRYFLVSSGSGEMRYPLSHAGETAGAPRLTIVDEWQRVRITLDAEAPADWWITPIFTISQSESGFERVYQGSAILAVWKPEPDAWINLTRTVTARIERVDRAG